jgi:hypothetical protein
MIGGTKGVVDLGCSRTASGNSRRIGEDQVLAFLEADRSNESTALYLGS